MKKPGTVLLPIVIDKNEDGYLARCPNIQGAFAEGDSIEEAVFNCIDIVKLIAQYRAERGEPLNAPEFDMAESDHLALTMPVDIA